MSNNHNSSTGKKRILIFSLAYHPVVGGAEIAVKEIADRIPDIEFDMVTMRFDPAHSLEERIGNVNVHRIKATKLTFPIEAALYGRKLHKNKPYDAVWSIMAARAGGATLFFKYSFPEVKYILTLQEGDPIEYMKRRSLYWVNPLFRKIFINADILQSISQYLADYAAAMGYKGMVEVIPNGVDVKNFQHAINDQEKNSLRKDLGLLSTDTVLITTSRLMEKNGIADVIDAMKLLPQNVKFLILGIGPLEFELKQKVKKLGLDSRVQFLGHVPYEEIPKYLHAPDIFIRTSIAEGFGNSFIEAMAAGLPVIATPVGGIVDFLFDPEENPNKPSTGLFAEPKDPESIAKQVQRLMNDEVLRQALIENAKKMVQEKYEWDLVAKEMKSRVFDRV